MSSWGQGPSAANCPSWGQYSAMGHGVVLASFLPGDNTSGWGWRIGYNTNVLLQGNTGGRGWVAGRWHIAANGAVAGCCCCHYIATIIHMVQGHYCKKRWGRAGAGRRRPTINHKCWGGVALEERQLMSQYHTMSHNTSWPAAACTVVRGGVGGKLGLTIQ